MNDNFNSMTNQTIQTEQQSDQYANMQQTYQQPSNQSNNKKNNSLKVIIIMIIVIVLGAGVFYFINNIKTNNESNNSDTPNVSENNNQNNDNSSNSSLIDNPSVGPDINLNKINDKDGTFLMNIEDVFKITGRGTVATGMITRGKVKVGEVVQIIGLDKETKEVEVSGIEMFRNQLEEAVAGDNVGILLKDVNKEDVERGQVLAVPNSIILANNFEAEIHVLTTEEKGINKSILANSRLQFYIRTVDITGEITLDGNLEKVNPGENAKITVSLVKSLALEEGIEFYIREGERKVGTGKITKVIE